MTKAILLFCIGYALGSLYLQLVPVISKKLAEPIPQVNMEVLGEYNGCKVLRFTPDGTSHYTYFLRCK